MINSSSVRFRRLFLCAFIDRLAFDDDFLLLFLYLVFVLAVSVFMYLRYRYFIGDT